MSHKSSDEVLNEIEKKFGAIALTPPLLSPTVPYVFRVSSMRKYYAGLYLSGFTDDLFWKSCG